jgi:small subunit ribosomal protein S9
MPGKNAANIVIDAEMGGDVLELDIGAPVKPVAPPPPAPVRAPRAPKPADKRGWWWGTGRRKTAIARVRMKPATGEAATITLFGATKKGKGVEVYFSEERDRRDAVSPLLATSMMGKFQIVVQCRGGGKMGQAQAMRLAVARALLDYDPSTEVTLRDNRMLTRDARAVERKKYGQAGARRRFQFSKR